MKWSRDQKKALQLLEGNGNIFLTGAAGSGKSTLLKEFIKSKDLKKCPLLASTGVSAVLIGGRTFHSFFGLGILEGGVEKTVERASKNKRVKQRLKKIEAFIIDEISMLSGDTLRAAECIARNCRDNQSPWGGVRVIAVGDFSQLPPVQVYIKEKNWAFLNEVWFDSEFKPVVLEKIHRTRDLKFIEILNEIRIGNVTPEVNEFMKKKLTKKQVSFNGTRLFARRKSVEEYNLKQLSNIDGSMHAFETNYYGAAKSIEQLKKYSPIPGMIYLKEGALVMLRQNDPKQRWVNGSLGNIVKINDKKLMIELKTGRTVDIEKAEFTLLNAEGDSQAVAVNFPVSLAYAITIHKAQGITLDQVSIDLKDFWEPGQAYVALSRVKSSKGLFLESWDPRAVIADSKVKMFHRELSCDRY